MKFVYLTVGVVFIAGSFYLFLQNSPRSHLGPDSQGETSARNTLTIFLGGKEILAEVANTPEERRQGLSGRAELGENGGMLFIFDSAERHGIWMKDMNFPIDILWLDEDKRVVHVEMEISPDTYPEVFLPGTPAKYVLELPAGLAASAGVDTGTIVSW